MEERFIKVWSSDIDFLQKFWTDDLKKKEWTVEVPIKRRFSWSRLRWMWYLKLTRKLKK